MAVMEKCQSKDIPTLERGIRYLNNQIRQYRSFLDCRTILLEIGPILYEVIKSVNEETYIECMDRIRELERVLEKRGCIAVFADSKLVTEHESMRVDFRDVLPNAVELPGLYSLDSEGEYCLIGTLGGTVKRRSEHEK